MSGSSSDSETTAESCTTALTAPTIATPAPDPLFAYLPTKVKDAVNKGPVTRRTDLAHLHRPRKGDRDANDMLLQDLVLSSFAVRCQLHVTEIHGDGVTGDEPTGDGPTGDDPTGDEPTGNVPTGYEPNGKEPNGYEPTGDEPTTRAIPHYPESGRHGCNVYLRTVDMLSAPAIRLEARFFRHGNQNMEVFHTASLDFHFNDCNGKQLHDFAAKLDEPAVVTYSANGATCEGFNFERKKLTVEQQAVYDELRSLITIGPLQHFRLELFVNELSQEALSALYKVFARLPGGKDALLPNIGCPEYCNFPGSVTITAPHSVMYRDPPNPMTIQSSRDTFKSMRDYAVQGSIAIAAPHFENHQSLLMFSACRGHKIALFEVNDFVVIAMKFDSAMNSLGFANKAKLARLPKELEIEISFTLPATATRMTTQSFQKVFAMNEPLPLHRPNHRYDAYFVISSHEKDCFEGRLHSEKDSKVTFTTVTALKPHMNRVAYEHSQEALAEITKSRFNHWHPILLNQLHDNIPIVDFLANVPVPEETKETAMTTLRTCKSWNEHQLQAIEDMRKAKGGLQLVDGTAGVGKTTLQIRQALLFVELGGRALCTTTANANADHWAREADRAIRESGKTDLRVVRLYSASRGVNIRTLTREQARLRRAGHGEKAQVSTLRDLLFKKLQENKAEAIDLSVETLVMDEAEKEELSLLITIFEEDEEPVDAWEVFRICSKAIDEDDFDWCDWREHTALSTAYEACKGHVIALSPILVTTNGNARCNELVEHWGQAETLYGSEVGEIQALGVLIDEAAKETEINIINTITTPGLPRKPDLVILYGDDRQLLPVNTCESRDFQINPFLERLDISLLGRLLRQGYPHSKLLIQHRMHPAISKFPSQMFYDGELCDAACVDRDLEGVLPGLKAVLHGIIALSFGDDEDQRNYLSNATDAQARLHWIEMPIVKYEDIDKDRRGSLRLNKHIDLFFEKVFPALQGYFKENMHDEVMLIVGYNHALHEYEDRMRTKQEGSGLPLSHYPRTVTIDAAQGQEASMVLIDGSMQWANHMGFMTQPGRCNVAMTRPKHVLWVIGGPMRFKGFKNYGIESPFVKLKTQLENTGQVHQFR